MKCFKVFIQIVRLTRRHLANSYFVQQTLLVPLRRFVPYYQTDLDIRTVNVFVLLNYLFFVLAFLQRQQNKILMPEIVVKSLHLLLFLILETFQRNSIGNDLVHLRFHLFNFNVLSIYFVTPTKKFLYSLHIRILSFDLNTVNHLLKPRTVASAWFVDRLLLLWLHQ